MSWQTVREKIKNFTPESYDQLGLEKGDAIDYVLCPYNSNTFPKHQRWIDQAGRYWVMEGDPGVWNVKLPRGDVTFPDIRTLVLLNYVTLTGVGINIQCRVDSIIAQTVAIIGRRGSRVCAKALLVVVGEVTVFQKE